MGGLGNGRRGGRSPPLLIGALIACILVLGFNYWVSSSRNLELQTKLYEMEGQARRGASERGAVEVKKKEFQEEVQRQKEQISRIEDLYKKQLEGSQSTCSQERGLLQLNISISTKTIKELKAQLNRLNEDLEKAQKDGQSCHGEINTLNKKLAYETTQCNTQILAQREQCEEKVSAAKLEVQKKMEKLSSPVSSQADASPILKAVSSEKVGVVNQEEPGKAGLDDTKTPLVIGPAPVSSQPKATAVEPQAPELLTNEIIVPSGPEAPVSPMGPSRTEVVEKPSAQVKDQESPAGGAVGQKKATPLLKKNLTEDKGLEVLDAHGEVTPPEDTDAVEELLTRQDAEMTKLDEPEDYDADEQIVGGADLDKQNQLADKMDAARELEEELADYNGDDDNEGEFEADKQAELARI